MVKVADGYALTYLLPRKLALLVTEGNKQQIDRERTKFPSPRRARREEGRRGVGRAVVRASRSDIARKVGETEVLFGSVTSGDIAAAMAAKGLEIDRRKLNSASRSRSSASTTFRCGCILT